MGKTYLIDPQRASSGDSGSGFRLERRFWLYTVEKMKNKRSRCLLFAVAGYSFLAIALLTGCSWSVEGGGLRVNSESDEPEPHGDNSQ